MRLLLRLRLLLPLLVLTAGLCVGVRLRHAAAAVRPGGTAGRQRIPAEALAAGRGEAATGLGAGGRRDAPSPGWRECGSRVLLMLLWGGGVAVVWLSLRPVQRWLRRLLGLLPLLRGMLSKLRGRVCGVILLLQ